MHKVSKADKNRKPAPRESDRDIVDNKLGIRKAKPTSRNDLIHKALVDTKALQRIFDNTVKDEDSLISYSTIAMIKTQQEIKKIVGDRLVDAFSAQGINELGVIYTPAGGTSSFHGAPLISMHQALKMKPKIIKACRSSISRLAILTMPSEQQDNPYNVAGVIASLLILAEGEPSPIGQIRSPAGRANGSLRTDPPLPDIWHSTITEEIIRSTVEVFFDAPKQLRLAAAMTARERKDERWRNSRQERALTEFQIDVLTPVSKTFFGVGLGDVILRQALAPSLVRAKKAKKNSGWVDRADLAHLMWEHALATNGPRPPIVKL